jgi:hypothetical protein
MHLLLKVLSVIGFISIALLVFGLYLDIKDLDRTRGAYQPPYTGATGTPVDWSSMEKTSAGLAKRGHVVNVLVDGTTGMISFEIFKERIDWQVFSDRALVVHKPREALRKRGFEPEF